LSERAFVPSPQALDGMHVLELLLAETRAVRAAIAFVTLSGVELLAELLQRHSNVEEVSLVVRAAPITEPDALLALRDRLGVQVSVIAGPEAARFHPKFWLLSSADGSLLVLSGSGNLTQGGLRDNREQFEVVRTNDSTAIEMQERRFEELTEGAIPLDRHEGSIAWRTWKDQLRHRAGLEGRLRELDQALAESHPESREADKKELLDDLWGIYERTREARLRQADGRLYVPSGLRLELEGARGSGEPVSIATRLCKSETDGFRAMLAAGQRDSTVESLVVDPSKGYHTLFPEEIRRASQERLQQFPADQRSPNSAQA
jgi:HKD family nuclease